MICIFLHLQPLLPIPHNPSPNPSHLQPTLGPHSSIQSTPQNSSLLSQPTTSNFAQFQEMDYLEESERELEAFKR